MYLSLRHIDSARLIPIALTLIRTSFGPGAGPWTSINSRTSGPPAFENLTVRDMAVSVKSGRDMGFKAGPSCQDSLSAGGLACHSGAFSSWQLHRFVGQHDRF